MEQEVLMTGIEFAPDTFEEGTGNSIESCLQAQWFYFLHFLELILNTMRKKECDVSVFYQNSQIFCLFCPFLCPQQTDTITHVLVTT